VTRGRHRLLLLALLVTAAAALHLSGLAALLDPETLAAEHRRLRALVAAHPRLAPAVFVLVYALSVAVSLPGATLLTLTGGFLFGTLWGLVWCALGATLGAVAVFLAARGLLAEPLRRRAGPWLGRLEAAFRRDAVSYLLFLRLVPIFPFWLVNLVPAFLGMRLLPYTLATLVGILPAGLVYVAIGDGLGELLARGARPDPAVILEPRFLLPLLGLAVLALLPALVRRRRAAVDGEAATPGRPEFSSRSPSPGSGAGGPPAVPRRGSP